MSRAASEQLEHIAGVAQERAEEAHIRMLPTAEEIAEARGGVGWATYDPNVDITPEQQMLYLDNRTLDCDAYESLDYAAEEFGDASEPGPSQLGLDRERVHTFTGYLYPDSVEREFDSLDRDEFWETMFAIRRFMVYLDSLIEVGDPRRERAPKVPPSR